MVNGSWIFNLKDEEKKGSTPWGYFPRSKDVLNFISNLASSDVPSFLIKDGMVWLVVLRGCRDKSASLISMVFGGLMRMALISYVYSWEGGDVELVDDVARGRLSCKKMALRLPQNSVSITWGAETHVPSKVSHCNLDFMSHSSSLRQSIEEILCWRSFSRCNSYKLFWLQSTFCTLCRRASAPSSFFVLIHVLDSIGILGKDVFRKIYIFFQVIGIKGSSKRRKLLCLSPYWLEIERFVLTSKKICFHEDEVMVRAQAC